MVCYFYCILNCITFQLTLYLSLSHYEIHLRGWVTKINHYSSAFSINPLKYLFGNSVYLQGTDPAWAQCEGISFLILQNHKVIKDIKAIKRL